MNALVGYPFVSWAGVSTPPDLDAESLATFNRFYDEVHIPEILANNPGFHQASRYALVESDTRGLIGPGWLTVYGIENEAAARAYVKQSTLPREQRPRQTPGPPVWSSARREWRMVWQRLSVCATEVPDEICVLGNNVPYQSDSPAIATFSLYDAFETPPEAAPQHLSVHPRDQALSTSSASETLWRLIYRRVHVRPIANSA